MNILKKNRAQHVVGGCILLLILYLSYRYPLQINFSGTSPTYSDTPFVLQIGKFLLAGLFSIVLLVVFRAQKCILDVTIAVSILSFTLAYAFLKGLASLDIRFIESMVWPAISFLLMIYSRDVDFVFLNKWMLRFFWFSFLFDFIQIVSFFLLGRLPALAYSDSISVRFGSFLDDPNGFSAICFLFFGWALFQSGINKIIYSCAAIAMILASQSLTAIGFLAVVLFIILCHLFVKKIIYFIGVVVLAIIAYFLLDLKNIFDLGYEFYDGKKQSISDHGAHDMTNLVGNNFTSIFLGRSDYHFFESWWLQAFVNYGLLWLLLIFGLSIYLIYRLYISFKISKNNLNRSIYFGFLLYAIYMVIGSFNLPFYTIFPNNFIFFLLLFFILGRRFQST